MCQTFKLDENILFVKKEAKEQNLFQNSILTFNLTLKITTKKTTTKKTKKQKTTKTNICKDGWTDRQCNLESRIAQLLSQ